MDKEWVKNVLPVIVVIIGGWWTLYSIFDAKFDLIDARLDDIDKRLARVEGWIEGRFDDASAEATSTSIVNADSLLKPPQIVAN